MNFYEDLENCLYSIYTVTDFILKRKMAPDSATMRKGHAVSFFSE
jgi:hypothetical protein